MDLTASSAVNLPISRASLRFVVMRIGVLPSCCTYSGRRMPPRFTFTRNLMISMIPFLLLRLTRIRLTKDSTIKNGRQCAVDIRPNLFGCGVRILGQASGWTALISEDLNDQGKVLALPQC